ncbi:MAG: hypothetical protein KA191_17825 [Verrucomicrobia bacterium]|jgi:hypothetical protein|nr:hypothetical protein [Candidatus Dechloromonas phosphoritropha]MBP7947900.1 hypothetical protein [Verrucomicrobiota bacterium]
MLIGSGHVSTEDQPAVKQGLKQELRRMWQQAIDDNGGPVFVSKKESVLVSVEGERGIFHNL